ncbi:MAG: M55 family metallopeptidase [Anaerolineae bacterium]|nr:M55 family metallopeptidase [Anaerolineae bacterium]
MVKYGINYVSARNLSPQKAQQRIRESAQRAVERARNGEMRPLTLETPIRFEVAFKSPKCADRAGVVPGAERTGGAALAYTGADMVEVNRAWVAMMRLS